MSQGSIGGQGADPIMILCVVAAIGLVVLLALSLAGVIS